MTNINTLPFDKETYGKLKKIKYGTNWPVVYIINNDKEVYIGETTNVGLRSNQHLANEVRKSLKTINIISDETFNKSSILDLESFLIKYMSADNKFKLQNGNKGLLNHNYYQREMYEKKFKEIWINLKSKGLVKTDLKVIANSDLFKYSPYKSLTTDQYMIVNDLLDNLIIDINCNSKSTFIVNGGAGTGKTIVGIYLIKLLSDASSNSNFLELEDVEKKLCDVLQNTCGDNKFKIGLVIPMDNLRASLKKVFREINGLNSSMVLSPNDVAKSEFKYDLLIVDESHRLRRRKNLIQYRQFDINNNNLNLGQEGTELDWITLKSNYQILFYDENQTIKPTDIPKSKIDELYNKSFLERNYNVHPYFLQTQLRCLIGGNEYIDYIKAIFSNEPPVRKVNFDKYDLKIFDDVNIMIEEIKQKDKDVGLSRTIAGYAWKWNTKGNNVPLHVDKKCIENSSKNNIYDIEIDGYKYIWNSKASDWINSENSINEIGSIHTTQGFDLNYTGLIIGNDLKYDLINKKFFVDRSNYFDVKGKNTIDDIELLKYILNIYNTMLTRGMMGTYIYVCDPNLRIYLKNFIDSIDKL